MENENAEKRKFLVELIDKSKKLIGSTLVKRFKELLDETNDDEALYLAEKAIKNQLKYGRKIKNLEFAKGFAEILIDYAKSLIIK